jgi:hypothetical protein
VKGAGPIAVGVTPAPELESRPRLFGALEAALPVRFEAREPNAFAGLDALLVLGGGDSTPVAPPVGLPTLTLALAEASEPDEALDNVCAAEEGLDSRLHGAALPDQRLGPALRQIAGGLGDTDNLGADGATILASCEGVPTWTCNGESEAALLIPAELGPQ